MIGIIAGLAGALAGAYAARGRTSTIFAPSVYRGPKNRKAIALTFDDGPSPSTPELLDLLDQYGAKGTFFQCGMHVRRLRDISRSIVAAGHEIGNHTDTHPRLWLRTPQFIFDEIGRAQESITDATGVAPVLFRATYGVRWQGLREAQARFGLTGVMWTTLALDWKLPSDRVARRLIRHAGNGAIFCLHDGRERATRPDVTATLNAVKEVVPVLIDAGYELTTVSDLIREDR